jgi:hypothetical protein
MSPAACKTFQGGPGSSPTLMWASSGARGWTSGLGLSRHVHRPTQNLRDSRNRALACISDAFRAVAWYSLNYAQQLIRGKEYYAGALWSLSAYGLNPHPVLRIFLYGPEHTVFLSLRSDFLCASKLRTRLFLRSAWELTCVWKSSILLRSAQHLRTLSREIVLLRPAQHFVPFLRLPSSLFAQRENSTFA